MDASRAAPSASSRALDLFFYSWRTSIACILAGMLVSVLLFGLAMPYWRTADQDLILAYQGLLFNDGLPQEYFDHTGYLSYLLIGLWYKLLHAVGLLPVHAVSEMPPLSATAAFEAAWQSLIALGRVLSLIIGGVFVALFAHLVRRLVGDWRIAVLAGLALAWSSGIAMHLRIMRTELLSSLLVTSALLLVLIATSEARRARLVLLALAGLAVALAVVAKLQAIFPALAIPVIALAFGQRADAPPASAMRAWGPALLLAVAAAVAAVPAAGLLLHGLNAIGQTTIGYRPLGGGLGGGGYQGLIAAYVAMAMAAYAAVWRVSLADTLAAMAAVVLGIALGLTSLDLSFQLQNVIAVANPVEHMFAFASAGRGDLHDAPQVLGGSLALSLLKGLGRALATHTFFLHPTHRPTLMIEWLAIAGAIVAWRRGDRRLPLQVGLMVLVVLGLDTLFTLRGLKLEYFAYSDPILIIAGALVLDRFPELFASLKAQRAGLAVMVVTILWAHASPMKAVLSRKDPRADCYWFKTYVARFPSFPFCQ
jgi:hypothetical protein